MVFFGWFLSVKDVLGLMERFSGMEDDSSYQIFAKIFNVLSYARYQLLVTNKRILHE